MKKTLFILLTLFLSGTVYAQRPFEKLDLDKDGKLDKKEFLRTIKPEKQEGMTKTFENRDKDGDGYLTLDEYTVKSEKKASE
jgi:Ca2+-binding EF-hand superfamily protein